MIRTLRLIKCQQTVIKQQPETSPNVTKASGIFLILEDDDMVQHIIPINNSGPQ